MTVDDATWSRHGRSNPRAKTDMFSFRTEKSWHVSNFGFGVHVERQNFVRLRQLLNL